tara:strand:- start:79 stop:273 length:195 start_codon:yes stop_codon:yes gene_type:complete
MPKDKPSQKSGEDMPNDTLPTVSEGDKEREEAEKTEKKSSKGGKSDEKSSLAFFEDAVEKGLWD